MAFDLCNGVDPFLQNYDQCEHLRVCLEQKMIERFPVTSKVSRHRRRRIIEKVTTAYVVYLKKNQWHTVNFVIHGTIRAVSKFPLKCSLMMIWHGNVDYVRSVLACILSSFIYLAYR